MNRAAISSAVIFVILGWAAATTAHSAETFKPGTEVEAFFLNKWWPGTVVDTNKRGEVLVEYEFAGGSQRRVFKPTEVRAKYEAGAISKLRTWSDASGQFKIQAVLLSITADQVTLRKPDLTEITLPIAKLSTLDQSFIKRMATEAEKSGGTASGAAIAALPVEQFATAASSLAGFGPQAQRTAIGPDPAPAYLTMKQGGAAFPTEDFFDRISAVIPVGGKDGWLLAAIENASPSEPQPSRLLWCALERSKIEGRQTLPPGEVVMDYHAPSHRLVTWSKLKTEGDPWGKDTLTLWEVLPTDKSAKAIVRWNADSGARGTTSPWARLITGDLVVQRYKSQEYVVWDAAQKQMAYRITQESFFAPEPILSAGRKYLFLPEDKAVRIFDAAAGKVVCTLPAPEGSSAVAVTSDGRKAAVLSRTKLTVFDLTNASAEPEAYQAEAIGTPFATYLSWLGDDRLIAETGFRGMVLYSLPHKVALWNYKIDVGHIEHAKDRRLREIADKHLVYAAAVSSGAQRGYAVGAALLPGPKVDETAASLDPESLMIVKPGSAVRLDVQAGENNARVQAALEREIAANGWKLSPDAAAVITAEMKRGETQQVTYRSFIGGAAQDQSASVTPFISNLSITVNGAVAWQSATSSGAPSVVRLGEGQSAQAEVDRWQKPNVEFFEKVDIPERILDPAKSGGLGTTQVTNRGLVAQ